MVVLRVRKDRGDGVTEEKEISFNQAHDDWFEQVMDTYGEALTKLAFNYVKDWNLAEDVVQDVFISCFKQYDKLEEILSLKAWLYRITINKCKDILKHSTRKKLIFNSILLEHREGVERSPEVQLVHNNEQLLLSTSVLALPIRYREVIILYYYDGLSIEEMSHILKANVNTLKTRLKRARKKLKLSMERWEAHG